MVHLPQKGKKIFPFQLRNYK